MGTISPNSSFTLPISNTNMSLQKIGLFKNSAVTSVSLNNSTVDYWWNSFSNGNSTTSPVPWIAGSIQRNKLSTYANTVLNPVYRYISGQTASNIPIGSTQVGIPDSPSPTTSTIVLIGWNSYGFYTPSGGSATGMLFGTFANTPGTSNIIPQLFVYPSGASQKTVYLRSFFYNIATGNFTIRISSTWTPNGAGVATPTTIIKEIYVSQANSNNGTWKLFTAGTGTQDNYGGDLTTYWYFTTSGSQIPGPSDSNTAVIIVPNTAAFSL